MNCFVFYVCVDGVLRGPIPGVGPGSGRPLPLSLKWASCVWALAWALGVRLTPARVFATVAPCFAHAYVARR